MTDTNANTTAAPANIMAGLAAAILLQVEKGLPIPVRISGYSESAALHIKLATAADFLAWKASMAADAESMPDTGADPMELYVVLTGWRGHDVYLRGPELLAPVAPAAVDAQTVAALEAVANPAGRIPAERVDEILAELNNLTDGTPDETAGVDWWDWICAQRELDPEATAAAHTSEVHLTDGTVLRWSETAAWTRAAVAR